MSYLKMALAALQATPSVGEAGAQRCDFTSQAPHTPTTAAPQASAPERILSCSECPWYQENSWTHYPELPLWCSWHFDHLGGDSQQCRGWRGGKIPHPDRMRSPRNDDFTMGKDEEGGANAVDNSPSQQVTCFQCRHFKPNDDPNPRQGWGRCLKRGRGRFGCATACDAALTGNVVGV